MVCICCAGLLPNGIWCFAIRFALVKKPPFQAISQNGVLVGFLDSVQWLRASS